MQNFILDRIIKLTPSLHRITELLKYDDYWHKFGGKISKNEQKALCGKVFSPIKDTNDESVYRCDSLEDLIDLSICPNCLKLWHERVESDFENNQLTGEFVLDLWENNDSFVKLFIENEGYDKFNNFINQLLYDYLNKNGLVDLVSSKMENNRH
jgi:hypothetical protein